MAYGFIYYLSNPSMPGLTKIGMTHKHPRERMEELTKATACPEPFEMLAFFDHPDPRYAESELHRDLAEYRVNNSREFFRVPYGILQTVSRQWIDAEGCSYTWPLDRLARLEWVESLPERIKETF